MKIAILSLMLILFTTSCSSQEKDFNVNYENFEISIPGNPGPWLKQNGKFYCYFTTDNDKLSSNSNHHFYILNKNGQIESRITVPEQLQTFYYDLYIKNDTIFTTEYYNQNTFFLDEKNKRWVETKKGIDLYYQDDNYEVYSLDFGEWGGVTWFKDKKNGKQYEFEASAPIINKLNNSYFITLENGILEIKNPQSLEESKEPYDYKKAVLQEKYFREGSYSLKGTKTIYKYKNDDYFNPKFSFATSFISHHKLFNIYKDSISTKIGIIENGNLKPVYKFKEQMIPIRRNYDWRQPIQNNTSQSFQFYTKEQNKYGIVDIQDNLLTITTFRNTYKESVLSKREMKQWFEYYFNDYFENFEKLKLDKVDSAEMKVMATDMTQNHKISHYLLDDKEVETPRLYRKYEEPELKLNTSYYYSPKEKIVELIQFEWTENKTTDKWITSINEDNTNYKLKFDEISKYLIKKLGQPKLIDHGTQEWEVKNKVIQLVYNRNLVELTMYKK
ncbi:hypothetical protein ACTS9C_02595 [Empedobacter brevis]